MAGDEGLVIPVAPITPAQVVHAPVLLCSVRRTVKDKAQLEVPRRASCRVLIRGEEAPLEPDSERSRSRVQAFERPRSPVCDGVAAELHSLCAGRVKVQLQLELCKDFRFSGDR